MEEAPGNGNRSSEDLGESFRQSRREFRFQIVAWIGFATWTVGYNVLRAGDDPDAPTRTVFGMPEWVFYGVALPWVAALVLTIWFALCFMKDTDLGGEEEA